LVDFFEWRAVDKIQLEPCAVYCELSYVIHCTMSVCNVCVYMCTYCNNVPTSWACCFWWHISSLAHSFSLLLSCSNQLSVDMVCGQLGDKLLN